MIDKICDECIPLSHTLFLSFLLSFLFIIYLFLSFFLSFFLSLFLFFCRHVLQDSPTGGQVSTRSPTTNLEGGVSFQEGIFKTSSSLIRVMLMVSHKTGLQTTKSWLAAAVSLLTSEQRTRRCIILFVATAKNNLDGKHSLKKNGVHM